MIRTAFVLVLSALVTLGCGGPNGPTAPTLPEITAPASPQPADGPRSSLSVNGQIVAGRYNYWLQVAVTAGAQTLVINRIDFQYPERAENTGFPLSHVTMQHVVLPGKSFTLGRELISTVTVSEVTALVSFTDSSGQSRQLSASSPVDALIAGVLSPSLRIDAFTVSGFMEGSSHAYWPRLTLTASAGDGPVTVTRLEFDAPGVAGGVLPLHRRWSIPAESTLLLFHGGGASWPEFYLTTDSAFERLAVTVSYLDDAGRSGDVSAVATVER